MREGERALTGGQAGVQGLKARQNKGLETGLHRG